MHPLRYKMHHLLYICGGGERKKGKKKGVRCILLPLKFTFSDGKKGGVGRERGERGEFIFGADIEKVLYMYFRVGSYRK